MPNPRYTLPNTRAGTFIKRVYNLVCMSEAQLVHGDSHEFCYASGCGSLPRCHSRNSPPQYLSARKIVSVGFRYDLGSCFGLLRGRRPRVGCRIYEHYKSGVHNVNKKTKDGSTVPIKNIYIFIAYFMRIDFQSNVKFVRESLDSGILVWLKMASGVSAGDWHKTNFQRTRPLLGVFREPIFKSVASLKHCIGPQQELKQLFQNQ